MNRTILNPLAAAALAVLLVALPAAAFADDVPVATPAPVQSTDVQSTDVQSTDTALKKITVGAYPVITGTPVLGSTLTVTYGSWTPAPVAMSFQWMRGAVAIAGATSSKYTLTVADIGTGISVSVTGKKTGYSVESRITDSTPYITAKSFYKAPTPVVTGYAGVGATLSGAHGYWSPSPALSYQWSRNGVAIVGATNKSYTLTAADLGSTITFAVAAQLALYAPTSRTSTPTGLIKLGDLTKTPTPTIEGTRGIGQWLTARTGKWTPSGITIYYQWNRNGLPIAGANKKTYQQSVSDTAAVVITVTVTGSKPGYKTVSRTSNFI